MTDADRPRSAWSEWGLPAALFLATFGSTLLVGAGMAGREVTTLADLAAGWTFAVPLMAILTAHELGHFIAGRIHGVDISPPYFIPMPLALLGTMGAVIRIRQPIRRRNALLDVGAAGPLAGLAVALPVLVYGIATSPVELLPRGPYILEGRSILYVALLTLLQAPIPEGYDIMLTPTALAGWAGLLVTMINLLPVGQLDGGHVAYALFGPYQDLYSERIRRVLPVIAVGVSAVYTLLAYAEGRRGAALLPEVQAGVPWLVWALVLWLMTRSTGAFHPPTGGEPLSRGRRLVGALTLALFGLLFMPAWIRSY